MDFDQLEKQSKNAFSALRNSEISPSPFMKTRVLAKLNERRHASKEVLFWRWVSGLTLAAFATVTFLHFKAPQVGAESHVVAMQPYVIHLDLGDTHSTGAVIAEIELPEGIHF